MRLTPHSDAFPMKTVAVDDNDEFDEESMQQTYVQQHLNLAWIVAPHQSSGSCRAGSQYNSRPPKNQHMYNKCTIKFELGSSFAPASEAWGRRYTSGILISKRILRPSSTAWVISPNARQLSSQKSWISEPAHTCSWLSLWDINTSTVVFKSVQCWSEIKTTSFSLYHGLTESELAFESASLNLDQEVGYWTEACEQWVVEGQQRRRIWSGTSSVLTLQPALAWKVPLESRPYLRLDETYCSRVCKILVEFRICHGLQ